ncbi:MAG: hypothetical protein KGJ63_11085 [Pseudomonadota bacterium]|nr:hypothetical protein [Pseudomonadota bacterium]
MSQGLFRQEVIDAKRGEWLGSIIVAAPPSRWLLTALALAATILPPLCFGDCTRSETLTAQQVPSALLRSIAAPSAGTITGLHVHDDQRVGAGEVWLQFASEQDSVALSGRHTLARRQTVQLKQGRLVGAGQPLELLLPAGSTLQVQLPVPGRAIGLVEPGGRVVLRYQAFLGRIDSVDFPQINKFRSWVRCA